MTPETLAAVLRMIDEGARVEALCAAADVSQSTMYAIIRKHRPTRARQRRRRTSRLPDTIRALAAIPTEPVRIAELLRISRAYVYRVLGE